LVGERRGSVDRVDHGIGLEPLKELIEKAPFQYLSRKLPKEIVQHRTPVIRTSEHLFPPHARERGWCEHIAPCQLELGLARKRGQYVEFATQFRFVQSHQHDLRRMPLEQAPSHGAPYEPASPQYQNRLPTKFHDLIR